MSKRVFRVISGEILFLAKLTVILVDVNDREPEFQPSNVYYARLSEASQPGIVVKQVTFSPYLYCNCWNKNLDNELLASSYLALLRFLLHLEWSLFTLNNL